MKKVAVVGAGIAGITTAYYLARQGHKVSVFEQEPHPAMRTSFANGGQVSVSNSEVWTTWSNVVKGVKWMFKKDAPLLIRPSIDFKQWSWISKFLYNTVTNQYKKNTEATIQMGIESRKLYDEICAEESLEFDRSDCGILHFYKDEKYFDSAKKVKELYNNNGLEWDILTAEQAISLDPTLKDVKGIVGAAWTPSDWTGDIHKFCYQLANILDKKYGVQFYYGVEADIDYLLDYSDDVVITAGVGSVKIAESLNDKLPIYPVKGYSITINNVNPLYLPKVSLLDDQAKIVTSSLGNRFRVAGTAELNGENYDILKDRIDPLMNWVRTNFPKINTHEYTSWACLRPMTPNMMPITKQSDNYENVFYNTGHGHLGWTLAPYTAKLISEQINGKT